MRSGVAATYGRHLNPTGELMKVCKARVGLMASGIGKLRPKGRDALLLASHSRKSSTKQCTTRSSAADAFSRRRPRAVAPTLSCNHDCSRSTSHAAARWAWLAASKRKPSRHRILPT